MMVLPRSPVRDKILEHEKALISLDHILEDITNQYLIFLHEIHQNLIPRGQNFIF